MKKEHLIFVPLAPFPRTDHPQQLYRMQPVPSFNYNSPSFRHYHEDDAPRVVGYQPVQSSHRDMHWEPRWDSNRDSRSNSRRDFRQHLHRGSSHQDVLSPESRHGGWHQGSRQNTQRELSHRSFPEKQAVRSGNQRSGINIVIHWLT